MSTVLSRANIADATAAVNAYEATCNSIFESFRNTVTTLTSSNWNGDGSDGCRDFFNSTSTPVLTDGVTSISKSIRDILANIEQVTLDSVDPQLGEANRSSGAVSE